MANAKKQAVVKKTGPARKVEAGKQKARKITVK